jgi:hypothetical protein
MNLLNQMWLQWLCRQKSRLVWITNRFLRIGDPIVTLRDLRQPYCVNLQLVALDLDAKKVVVTAEPEGAKGIVGVHPQPTAGEE